MGSTIVFTKPLKKNHVIINLETIDLLVNNKLTQRKCLRRCYPQSICANLRK